LANPGVLPPNRLMMVNVKMAPSGAAKEKIMSRFRMPAWSNPSDSSVVVRPSAVGPDISLATSTLTLVHDDSEKHDQAQSSLIAHAAGSQRNSVRRSMDDQTQGRVQPPDGTASRALSPFILAVVDMHTFRYYRRA
jgi:hypothetical protein